MYFVYILKSINNPAKHYVGITRNLEKRLKAHNSGKTVFGNKYRPWTIEVYISFNNLKKVLTFERYLKRGSGHAFFKSPLDKISVFFRFKCKVLLGPNFKFYQVFTRHKKMEKLLKIKDVYELLQVL